MIASSMGALRSSKETPESSGRAPPSSRVVIMHAGVRRMAASSSRMSSNGHGSIARQFVRSKTAHCIKPIRAGAAGAEDMSRTNPEH